MGSGLMAHDWGGFKTLVKRPHTNITHQSCYLGTYTMWALFELGPSWSIHCRGLHHIRKLWQMLVGPLEGTKRRLCYANVHIVPGLSSHLSNKDRLVPSSSKSGQVKLLSSPSQGILHWILVLLLHWSGNKTWPSQHLVLTIEDWKGGVAFKPIHFENGV